MYTLENSEIKYPLKSLKSKTAKLKGSEMKWFYSGEKCWFYSI